LSYFLTSCVVRGTVLWTRTDVSFKLLVGVEIGCTEQKAEGKRWGKKGIKKLKERRK
jgi:hypothetical protein